MDTYLSAINLSDEWNSGVVSDSNSTFLVSRGNCGIWL